MLNSAASAAQLMSSAEIITALKHKIATAMTWPEGKARSHTETATVYRLRKRK
jgi:hypothetical protein